MNDYDELYQHGTSPYLKDSDSDGFNDAEEINSSNDPNCPRGQTCVSADVNTNAATNSDTNAASSDAADAATLRETLKNAGAPASVIDATGDATLLRLYQDVVSGNSNTNSDSLNVNVNSTGTLRSAHFKISVFKKFATS